MKKQPKKQSALPAGPAAPSAMNPKEPLTSSVAAPGSAPPQVSPGPPAAAFADVHADPRPLPPAYGKTLITVLPRDPEWLFAYWEINPSDRQRFGIDGDGRGRRVALRVYDVTGAATQTENVSNFYDVRVTEYASSWYLHVALPGRSWLVDLGVYDEQGEFVVIARSNRADTPPNRASDVIDDQWVAVDEERYEGVLRASGGENLLRLSASEALGPEMAWRLKPQFLMGASEQLFGASEVMASEAAMRRAEEEAPQEAPFRLQAACELIVYGATEPDATLTICAEPVRLRPDGTFSLRFALPDGHRTLDVKAVKRTGDQAREITVKIAKETH